MKTKNKYFAEYFINEIDKLKREIEKFGEGDESYFGNEIGPDKSAPIREQLEQLGNDYILDLIRGIEEEWENCVALNAKEGYPVIDCWNEELEETEGPRENEKIYEAIRKWKACNNELKDLMKIPQEKLTPELREKIQAKHRETMQAWKIYSELNN